MPRRELNEEEQIIYEELTKVLNIWLPDARCEGCIGLLDDLIDVILKNEKEETNNEIY